MNRIDKKRGFFNSILNFYPQIFNSLTQIHRKGSNIIYIKKDNA